MASLIIHIYLRVKVKLPWIIVSLVLKIGQCSNIFIWGSNLYTNKGLWRNVNYNSCNSMNEEPEGARSINSVTSVLNDLK